MYYLYRKKEWPTLEKSTVEVKKIRNNIYMNEIDFDQDIYKEGSPLPLGVNSW
jgi:hypothetical protein